LLGLSRPFKQTYLEALLKKYRRKKYLLWKSLPKVLQELTIIGTKIRTGKNMNGTIDLNKIINQCEHPFECSEHGFIEQNL
jgi:hypothetical protein